MTDFETRARAAARAVHAVTGAPADELTSRRNRRGPTRALVIAAAVVVIAAIVGTTLAVRDEGAGPASDVGTFCAQVQQMLTRPVDVINGERQGKAQSLDFLRDAPAEIRPAALAILQARTEHPNGSVPVEVAQRFLSWWQLRCYPDAATPAGGTPNARFAPVPAPASFRPCGASNSVIDTPERLNTTFGTIAVYGDRRLADPYDGPMIGIVRSVQQQYYSDDHAQPFPIVGHPDAELIDATGPFGGAIDGLGPAITWKDNRGFISVVGRGWSRDQAAELAAIATRVTDGSDGDTITDATRDHLSALYRGPVGEIYVQYASNVSPSTFTASYQVGTDASLQFSGSVPGPGGVEATRFFARGLRPKTVGGRSVLEGVLPATSTVEGTTVHVVVWSDGDVRLVLKLTSEPGTRRRRPTSTPSCAARTAWIAPSGSSCSTRAMRAFWRAAVSPQPRAGLARQRPRARRPRWAHARRTPRARRR